MVEHVLVIVILVGEILFELLGVLAYLVDDLRVDVRLCARTGERTAVTAIALRFVILAPFRHPGESLERQAVCRMTVSR